MIRDGRPSEATDPWLGRRLALAGLLGLGACGFRPLYGPVESTDGQYADIRTELAAVRVGWMGERVGQIMRRELERRFEGSAPGTQGRYMLTASIGFAAEVLGYRTDGTISRVRYTATGNWSLATQSVPPRVIARSVIPFRTIDAFNVPDLQFFSADTSRDAMERRLVDAVSEDIYREVALALRRYKTTGQVQAARGDGPARG